MGTKRVEGKKKKKSIKAKVTSKFSEKRKLSRMGKKVKKGMMGPNTDFMTRSSVIKKLQITLKDFRRLCILKGIYPRIPPKAPQGTDKIYYDIKDISYLAHEPLLHKFREFKAFMKKIRKAAGRNQHEEARRKDRLKPILRLDHLVRERYPRFIDALRDMDDALCMIHLFASLPSIGRITADKTNMCKELVYQWQYICIKNHSLNKVFVSIKGIYYQVIIMGEEITWLVPHPFTQTIPSEVDLRVMITFLEFYEVFLKFVMYKLYHMEGLQYPPIMDKSLYENGCGLLSIKAHPLENNVLNTTTTNTTTLSTTITASATTTANNTNTSTTNTSVTSTTTNAIIKKSKKESFAPELLESLEQKLKQKNDAVGDSGENNDDEDDEDDDEIVGESLQGPLSTIFAELHADHTNTTTEILTEEEKKTFHTNEDQNSSHHLFSKFKFFLNREVPLEWMQFLILSYGGHIGWENKYSPYSVSDNCITHHVIDRPLTSTLLQTIQPSTTTTTTKSGNNNNFNTSSSSSREFIQPQWIFDSINMKLCLPTFYYKPGVTLPPHLSPFVDDEKEGYIPKFKEELKKLKNTTKNGGLITDTNTATTTTNNDMKKGQNTVTSEKDNKKGINEEEDEEDENDDFKPVKKPNTRNKAPKSKNTEAKTTSLSTSIDTNNNDSTAGTTNMAKGPKAIVKASKSTAIIHEDEEAKELSKIMMSRKTKRLYGKMEHGIQKRQEMIQKLHEKRQKLSEENDNVMTTDNKVENTGSHDADVDVLSNKVKLNKKATRSNAQPSKKAKKV